MFSAYDAATRTIDPKQTKKDIGKLGSLVAGITQKSLEKAIAEQTSMHMAIEHYERDIRDKHRQIRLKEDQIKSLRLAPTNIKREITRHAKDSVALKENLIDDLKIVEGKIFITTTDLAFAESKLQAHKHTFTLSNLNIGRFLIMICPERFSDNLYLKSIIQICNLTWRVGSGNYFYHHPFIKEGGRVCFGETEPDFKHMLTNLDIIGVIDLALALLVTPDDGSAWIGWKQYFEEREPIEQKLVDTEPYWRFEDGPQSIDRFYKDPKKTKLGSKRWGTRLGAGGLA